MERGLNLEALTEEDGEESSEGSDESSGEEGEAGVQGGEPNQFDNLCDGVLTSMALVHASLGEMLDLKDELLRHSLPPSVLTRSVLVTSKVFRSFSDMHVPIGELIRMVRLYSTPWEEKSTALKKLHDDYEGKKTQLNIALKRLEFNDAHSKRISRERRVMNWEKLFAKLTAAKGHGRRWKFLIDAFKKRAGLGMEKLQEYLDSMDSSDDEGEEEEEPEVATQMQQVIMGSPSLNHQEEEEEEEDASSESESSSEDEYEGKVAQKESEVQPGLESGSQQLPRQRTEEEEVRKTVVIKPPMKDAEVMAGEPEFDRELHIRVFEPEGLDCRELKCVLTLGESMWKTHMLDMNHKEGTDDAKVTPREEIKPPTTPKRGGKGRSMIGGRGSRMSPSKTPTLQMAPLPENDEEAPGAEQEVEQKYFEEAFFALPEEPPKGQYVPGGREKVIPSEHLRVAVHFGPREEIVAMATIHMSDLQELDLPTIILGPPLGDVFDAEKAMVEERERSAKRTHVDTPENAISMVERANTEHSEELPEDGENNHKLQLEEEEAKDKSEEPRKPKPKPKLYDVETEKSVNKQLADRKAFDFPLYSIHSGKSDTVHQPCGKLPLLCFWVKKEVPTKLSKITESESVNALVLDLTGIDLNVKTKEDLNKEMRDEALSTISFTPEPPKEEMVPRTEYDQLMSVHKEEMEIMQSEYEQHLQEMMATIQNLQEAEGELLAHGSLPPAMMDGLSTPYSHSGSTDHSRTSQRASAQLYNSSLHERASMRHSTAEGLRSPPNKQTETAAPLYMQPTRPQQPRVGKPLQKWGKHLSTDFLERLQQFEELSQQKHAELQEQIVARIRSDIEQKMASQYRLAQQNEEGLFDAMQDVSLPAVFLPSKGANLQIFNPRAHKYFHPIGTGGTRLSQPPSILMLPPLPKSKMSVLNLFDMSQNFHRGGPDWLMQRYLSASGQQEQMVAQQQQELTPQAPTTTPSAQQQQRAPDLPLKPNSASRSLHSQAPSPAKSPSKSRQTGSGSSKSRHSVASGRVSQQTAPATSPARHQVTLPGNTPPMEAPSPQRPRTNLSSAGSSRQQQQQQMASVTSPEMRGRISIQSVSPADYVPPRSAMTISVTPGMLKSPNPVGQQEAGLVAPIPNMQLVESATPT